MNAGRLNLRMALLTSQNDMYTIGRGSGEMLGGDACTLHVKKPTQLRPVKTKPARVDRGVTRLEEERVGGLRGVHAAVEEQHRARPARRRHLPHPHHPPQHTAPASEGGAEAHDAACLGELLDEGPADGPERVG